jgi:hypothetical protein
MHFDIPISIMLIKTDDIPGMICSWCPQLDVFSQGESVGEAIAMCLEACKITCEDSLSAVEWVSPSNPSRPPRTKRVQHPLRRGLDPSLKTDESYAAWEDYAEERGHWGATTHVKDDEFMSGPERVGITHGRIDVTTLGGIVFVSALSRYESFRIAVPAMRFRLEYDETFKRSKDIWVRASEFEASPDMTAVLKAVIEEELTATGDSMFGRGRLGHQGQSIRITGVRAKEDRRLQGLKRVKK